MGGLVKTVLSPVQSVLGGLTAHSNAATPDKSPFDISKQAQTAQTQFNPVLQSAQANQAAVSPLQQQALTQMGLAATGQGPSLAEMQLRSAQDRGFAQQLAAAQSQRASSPALAQRQLLLNQGNANRDLAQQAAQARLQERDAFLNQANQQQANLGSAVNQNFQLATAPNQSLQQWELARTGAINQNNQANAQSQNAITGAILGGAGSALGGWLGKKDGGPVKGPGTSTSDSIPVKLSNGEFVVKASEASKPAVSKLLEAINAGKIKEDKIEKLMTGAAFGKVVASRSKDKKKD